MSDVGFANIFHEHRIKYRLNKILETERKCNNYNCQKGLV